MTRAIILHAMARTRSRSRSSDHGKPSHEPASIESLRLPKQLAEEIDEAKLAEEIVSRARTLWKRGERLVPRAELTPNLEAALERSLSAGRIVRGQEAAERALAAEAQGQRSVDRKTGVARGGRVSRLLIVTDDGAERFYRSVESLIHQHAPRVLGLRLAVDQQALGKLLFGPDEVARLVLVDHKSGVSDVLLALAADWDVRDAPEELSE
jgi:hypothetical protein